MTKNAGFKTGLIWIIASIGISGCSDSKSVDYYYNHQLEAREKIKECQKEEGGLQSSEACMNAVGAVRKWANPINVN